MSMDEIEYPVEVWIDIKQENYVLMFFDTCRNFMPEGKLTETFYNLRQI